MRTAKVERKTKETDISVALELDGSGRSEASTGLPFFDHMLSQLGKHGGFDLDINATGDLEVDAHHTVEDTGLALGDALREALGDKAGIRRFASIALPLDEEFWRAFATNAAMTLHLRMRSGKNPHHVLEASFKAVARCLRDAVRVEGDSVPSTKG